MMIVLKTEEEICNDNQMERPRTLSNKHILFKNIKKTSFPILRKGPANLNNANSSQNLVHETSKKIEFRVLNIEN